MDWIGANWIWLLFGIGLVWFLVRRGMGAGMGCGMSRDSHDAPQERAHTPGKQAVETSGSHAPGAQGEPPRRRHGCCS